MKFEDFKEIVNESHPEIMVWVDNDVCHCRCAAANEYAFSVSLTDLSLENREGTISLLLRCIPRIQNLDAEVAKSYDNAFQTYPEQKDILMVKALIKKIPSLENHLGHLVNIY